MSDLWRGTSGIYEIVNVVNGVRYVGSAKCLATRQRDHMVGLRRGSHENRHLQNAWNKHGADAFEFKVIAVVGVDDLHSTEQRLLNLVFGDQCYNIRRTVSPAMLGKSMPESSSNRRGRVFTAEHCANISRAKLGKPGTKHTAQSKAAISLALSGRTFSDDRKAKLSSAHVGKPLSQEHREAIGNGARGRSMSEGQKQKLRESVGAWWDAAKDRSRPTMRNPDTRRKIAEKKRLWWAAKRAAERAA